MCRDAQKQWQKKQAIENMEAVEQSLAYLEKLANNPSRVMPAPLKKSILATVKKHRETLKKLRNWPINDFEKALMDHQSIKSQKAVSNA